MKMPFL